MAITTTSVLSAPVQQSFNMKLLSTPTANKIYNVPAMRSAMPRDGGTTARYRRYNKLDSAIVPLGPSGIDPQAQTLTAVDIDAKMDFYGTYIILNEQVTLQSQDPVLNAAAERLADSLRTTEDQLTRNMLASTASFINCIGGVNGQSPTEISRSDANQVVSTLVDNDANMILDNMRGEDRFGTAPVRDAYFALASSKLIPDLENVNGFNQKNNYPAPMNALRSEWGNLGNLRFLLTSDGSVTPNASSTGQDVYNIFCVGMEAYAVVEQDGMHAEFIYRPPVYDGPLALNSTAAYKFATVPRILNDLWVINLRTTLG